MRTEIIFVSAVVIIVLINFLLLNTFSEQNNAFARNYVRATQLVQERIRAMLDIQGGKTDKLIIIDDRLYSWKQIFDESVMFPACTNLLDPTINCEDFILSECPPESYSAKARCIIRNKSNYTDDSWTIKNEITLFSQKIRITDGGLDTKKATVFIWWYDQLGLRKSVITRELKIQ